MIDTQKVMKALNCHIFAGDYCHDCPYYDSFYCSEMLASDAKRIMEQLQNQIADTKSCKLCANYHLCDSDSCEMFAECRGSEKKNWRWKGVDLE